ncbi:MAG: hypothetical protein IKR04_06025 [Clostridia bacterium]|nr:hypothetical protein [Clostridia bacterium]
MKDMFGRAFGFAVSMLLLNTSDYEDDIKREKIEREKQRQKEQLEYDRYSEQLMREIRNIRLEPMTYN